MRLSNLPTLHPVFPYYKTTQALFIDEISLTIGWEVGQDYEI